MILALFLLGCDSGGLIVRDASADAQNDTTSQNDASNQVDTESQNDAECQVVAIGQIHSWNAMVMIPPPGVQPGIVVYLDDIALPESGYYFVLDGPNVLPHGDYVYIITRGVGDHTVSVSYGCTP